jgi:hypothetical protein
MAKDPAHRYLSYADFKMALEAARSIILVQQMQQREDPEPPPQAPSHTSWWKR